MIEPWGIDVGQAVEIAQAGGIPRRFVVHKFGQNSTSAAGDAMWETGGAYPYLTYTAATTVRVASGGNAADTSDGAGARSITVQGLDENFEIASETITLAGASASSSTTTTFSRVLRCFVATAGANRLNTADIVVENTAGTQTLCTIKAGKGQSLIGFVTVPAGYVAYLTHILMNTEVSSASATVQFEGWNRSQADVVTAPFSAARVFTTLPALSRENGNFERDYEEPIWFNEKTDIWFELTPSTGTPSCSIQFTMLFAKK